MSSFEWPDLSCLASLGRDQNLDMRPVLLRIHTDLFVAAPSRDRATIEAFEALALGFLPIVDDATAAIVARKLAHLPDTPQAIVDALIRRGGKVRDAVLADQNDTARQPGTAPAHKPIEPVSGRIDMDERRGPRAPACDDPDLALAQNPDALLDSAQWRDLVDRARERPQLAVALLARADLNAGDEAVLYLHADDARRQQIRSRLETTVAVAGGGPSLGRADRQAVERLLGLARAQNILGFEGQLASMLHLAQAPAWHFQREPKRELLALALVAAGVALEDCIRIFLTIHPAISRSVKTVFHLAHLARSVPRPVAVYVIEAVLGVTIEAKREGRYVPATAPSATPLRGRAARPTVAQIRAAVLARRAG